MWCPKYTLEGPQKQWYYWDNWELFWQRELQRTIKIQS